MRRVDTIYVHHSASPRSTTIAEIRKWHLAKGWVDIGYHFVVDGQGVIHAGRPVEVVGSHVANHNAHSIGICVTGDNTKEAEVWTADQINGLVTCIALMKSTFGDLRVLGHRDAPGAATKCPGLDVRDLLMRRGRKMTPVEVTTEPRPATPPAVGGLRGAITGALLTLLLKTGLDQETSTAIAIAIGAAVLGGLTYGGKLVRDYVSSADRPAWVRLVAKLLPF